MPRAGPALAVALLALAVAPVGAAAASPTPTRATDTLRVPRSDDRRPPGRLRTARELIAVAARQPAIRDARRGRRGSYARAFLKGADRWQVSFYATSTERPLRREEIGQVLIDDRSGRVREVWTGPQVTWTMARGYPGAFGRKVNALYVWLPLCLLFLVPYLRPPWRLLQLDLLVLVAFSVSYAFFGAAEIGVSVPLVYPLLVYLLVRMLALAARRSRGVRPVDRAPLRLLIPPGALVIAIVFLLGFRVGLNVTASNVIDVGYAGVIGADRVTGGDSLYGAFPADNANGDTYGPVNYLAYVPFELVLPWTSGRWDSLPAAHAAAIVFDLGCVLLLWLLGRRVRGPTLGLLLAYAWVTFPFTLLVSNSNANDALVALLVLAAVLAVASPPARGALVAVAGLTKFAPLALAPLFATYRGGLRAGRWPIAGAAGAGVGRGILRPAAVTLLALAAAAAVLLIPLGLGESLGTAYERTVGFQRERSSPFSIWGYYGGLGTAQAMVTAAAAALAVVVAFVPRRRDVIVVAALGAAVLIALQLSVTYWFYLYLVWFFPLVLVALLGSYREPA